MGDVLFKPDLDAAALLVTIKLSSDKNFDYII
jgi:hypothetical protein